MKHIYNPNPAACTPRPAANVLGTTLGSKFFTVLLFGFFLLVSGEGFGQVMTPYTNDFSSTSGTAINRDPNRGTIQIAGGVLSATGSNGNEVTKRGYDGYLVITAQSFYLRTGYTYTVSFDARSGTRGGVGEIRVLKGNSTAEAGSTVGTPLNSSSTPVAMSANMSRYAITFTVSANQPNQYLSLHLSNSSVNNSELFIDNLSIAEACTTPSAPAVTNASPSRCGAGNLTLEASGAQTWESYRWYTTATGGTAIAGVTGATYVTSTAGTYYVAIVNNTTGCGNESTRTAVTATINPIPAAPTVANATVSRCGEGEVTLAASGATTGQSYRWYTTATGGTAIAGATGATYVTSTAGTYYVAIVNNTSDCESARVSVTATMNPVPAAPTVANATVSRCGEGEMTLTASGAATGQSYRWYNPSGVLIFGQISNSYVTSVAGAYSVSIVNDATGCESTRVVVTAVINLIPSAPADFIVTRCGNGTVRLTPPSEPNITYRWYSSSGGYLFEGTTYTTPVLSSNTVYLVSKVNTATLCEGTKATVNVIINPVETVTGDIMPRGEIDAAQPVTFSIPTNIVAIGYRWYIRQGAGEYEFQIRTSENTFTLNNVPADLNGVMVEVEVGPGGCYGTTVSPITEGMLYTFTNETIIPLPVELISFKAQRHTKGVNLTWATASELDNRGFEIQMSTDSKTFQNLGFVESKVGTTSIRQDYSFLDTRAVSGTRYYRLKQIDFDGTSSYSAVRAVSLGSGGGAVTAYPNPFEDVVIVTLSGTEARQVRTVLTNAMGKVLLERSEETSGNSITVNMAGITSKGIYMLHVLDGDAKHTFKLIKR